MNGVSGRAADKPLPRVPLRHPPPTATWVGSYAAFAAQPVLPPLPCSDDALRRHRQRCESITEISMLHYAVIFFVIALIAAVFGFAGIAAGAAGIAKILFFVFLILAVVSFIANTARR
jgi:uncharacterized membrane protein YtjA (UPF0391 family)